MQINIGHLNEEGVYITGQFSTFALVGAVRAQVGGLPVAAHMSADCFSCWVHVSVPLLDLSHVLLLFVLHCTVARKGGPLCAVQGEGDSAIDLLWQKRRQEVGQ